MNFEKSKYRYLRRDADKLSKLVNLAEELDFTVRFRRTKEMIAKGYDGLMRPDSQVIYVNPNYRAVETLAHEIAHAIMYCIEGSQSYHVDEQIADVIGYCMCFGLGYEASELAKSLPKLLKRRK